MDAFGDYEPTDEPHLMNQPVTRQQTDTVCVCEETDQDQIPEENVVKQKFNNL